MLDTNNHRGKFGEDYVRVLASAAGLLWSKDDVDQDGVDLSIKLPEGGSRYSPRIEVQVKTTSRPVYRGGELVFHGLDQVQFNRLAGSEFTVPRYLFVVCVPSDAAELVLPHTPGLLLRHLGYFRSLHDETPFARPNRARSARVLVPVANVLTVRSLAALVRHEPVRRC